MESRFGKYDAPLYTGRLVGLRSFAVTPKGELTGVTYAGRWVDGENEAKCATTDDTFYDWDKGAAVRNFATPPQEHHVAALTCSCGYYAYFDGNVNEFQQGVHVESVVEAWGKITIGDKGFRASKARIAALVIPKDAYPSSAVEKLIHRIECKAKWNTAHAWSYPYLANENGCELPLFPHPDLMQTIINRYPSARIFNTIDDATAAFPLTPIAVAKEIVGVE